MKWRTPASKKQYGAGTGAWRAGIGVLLNLDAPIHFGSSWFLTILIVVLLMAAIAELFVWRLHLQRKKELEQQRVQAQMMELQDKALRAQMNPHFIFNCLNSIKSLVQESRNELAVQYLTTFTKLMRTVLQNADKRYVTLYDELETCRLYLELESLRFNNRFSWEIRTSPELDLKSLEIPALIIQPLVENAIWHGIMPNEGRGKLTIAVHEQHGNLICSVDDDGIGRDASAAIHAGRKEHQPKGVNLATARIDLYRLLHENDASMEIIDKKNEDGSAAGTRVELCFSLN